jgi:transposase-like protein
MPTPRARSPYARLRWKEADAREVIAALERSGQSVRAFAAAHGLDAQRVYLWRRRFRAGSANAEPTTFRELTVPHAGIARPELAAFEIVLASGAVVRVPAKFDSEALALLLDVMGRAPAC